MLRSLVRRWFILALVSVLVAGFGWHALLKTAVLAIPRDGVVFTVLFLMAVTLDADSMWRALRRPAATILATAVNFGLVPLLAWGTSSALAGLGWLGPDFATGLVIAGALPSTLASAAVWTRRAGGNDAVALLVTMLTNVSCFLVTPLWLIVATATQVEIDMAHMVQRLAIVVVTPMVLAQLLRRLPPLGQWATAHKIPLGVLAQCGILTMVLIGAVHAGGRLADSDTASIALAEWGVMIAAVVTIHLAGLSAGHLAGWGVGVSREDRIAIGFSGSQKTLMVGLLIALQFYSDLPVAMLPMIVYHVSQLLLDTVVADRLRRSGGSLC